MRRVADGKLVKAAKINQAIGRLKERYPRVARYFRIAHDPQIATIVCEFDAVKHAKAEQLDGCYLSRPIARTSPATSSGASTYCSPAPKPPSVT